MEKDALYEEIMAMNGGKMPEKVVEDVAKEEPVKEEVVKEEPVKEEPIKEEPVKEDLVVPEGYIPFKEKFKDWESPDHVLAELSSYKEKLAAKEKAEAESKSAFAPGEDEELYKLRMIKKDKPDKYEIAKKLILGNPGPLELIKLNLKNNTPSLSDLTEEELDLYIKDKYVLTMDGVDEEDESQAGKAEVASRKAEIAKSKVALRIDGDMAKKQLMSDLHVDVPVKKTAEEIIKENEQFSSEFQTKWSPGFADAKGKLNKLPITVQGEKGLEVLFDIELPVDKTGGYVKQAAEYLYNNKIMPTPENKDFVVDFVRKAYIVANLEDIATKIVRKARELTDEEWLKLKHNSKPITNTSAPPAPPKKKTTESVFEEQTKGW